jgi:arylsulfatase A-like enzyme
MVAVNWLVRAAVAAAALGSTQAVGNHQIPLTKDTAHKKPNIVFILTDDQDIHMNSLDYVPLIKEHLLDRGTFYRRHFCTIAVCCPSRVNLWTGRAGHNTNVTDLVPPYGMSGSESYY